MSVTDYFAKMTSLADEMTAAGKSLDDEELVAYILNGLDAEFNPVVSALLARVEVVPPSEVLSQLLGFENRLDLQRGGGGAASANMANRGRGNTNMLRGRGGNRGRNQGRSQGRGGGGRSNGLPQQSCNRNYLGPDTRPECQVCGKKGHIAIDCWHRYDESYSSDKSANAAYGVDTNWYADSGATDHITGELDKLTTRDKYGGNDQVHTASGKGSGHEDHTS